MLVAGWKLSSFENLSLIHGKCVCFAIDRHNGLFLLDHVLLPGQQPKNKGEGERLAEKEFASATHNEAHHNHVAK